MNWNFIKIEESQAEAATAERLSSYILCIYEEKLYLGKFCLPMNS